MRPYRPKVGYHVLSPFSGGASQNSDDKQFYAYPRWFEVRHISEDEACQLLPSARQLHNKCAIVIAAGDRYVDAVYFHDCYYAIIRTSHRDTLPDRGRGVEMHDAVQATHLDLLEDQWAELWACRVQERAEKATDDAIAQLSRTGYLMEKMPPLNSAERYRGPDSTPRVYVPMARVTTEQDTFEGKLCYNDFGEPIGIWTGTALI